MVWSSASYVGSAAVASKNIVAGPSLRELVLSFYLRSDTVALVAGFSDVDGLSCFLERVFPAEDKMNSKALLTNV